MKEVFKNKKVIIGVVVAILLLGIGGYFIYDNHRKTEIMNKMEITFTDVKEVEYGTKDFDVKKELIKEVKEAKLTKTPELDTSKIGEVTLKFNLEKSDVTKEVEYKIKVVDTKAPEITLETDSKELTVGDTYDIKSNVKSVKDVIDGDIQEVEKKEGTKNGYYIEGQINNKKVGEYKVKVIAFDKHGLKAEKDFTVNIKEKKVEKPVTNNGTSSSPSNNSSGGTIKRGSKQDIINTALAQVGKTYAVKTQGPNSFDCSGLIWYAYTQNGWSIPRYPESGGKKIPYGESLQQGDIIYMPSQNHVALYIGNDRVVEAKNPEAGIITAPLWVIGDLSNAIFIRY